MISVLDLGFGPEELASVKQHAAPTVIPQGNAGRRAGWKVENYKYWAATNAHFSWFLDFACIVQLLVIFDRRSKTVKMCHEEKQQIKKLEPKCP